EKRSKASAEKSRHEGRTNVPGGEFGSELRRQSSGRHRIPKTLPGFLAHFIPTGRLGHARSVVHEFRQVAQACLCGFGDRSWAQIACKSYRAAQPRVVALRETNTTHDM